jgi:hypothetical protein
MTTDFTSQVQANFAPKQVSVEEFAESSEYCNKRVYPRQKILLKLMFLEELTNREEDILDYWISGGANGELSLSPKIRERAQFLRDKGFQHFREIVLVGGRRCSKGFVTGIAMAKLMYDTLMLGDSPGEELGIDPKKEIYFSCLAGSLDQAQKYQYADFSSTVGGCRAFQRNLTKLYEREFSIATEADMRAMASHKRHNHRIGRDESKLRGVALAANANTVRGSATMAAVFDEMAFMEVGEETDASAEKVYDALEPSLAQFGKHAMIFCNSSPYTKLGRFFERFDAGMKIKEDGTIFDPYTCSFQFPSWALFEGWWEDEDYVRKASKMQKQVITASPDWDPERKNEDGSHFYTELDRENIELARNDEQKNPDIYKVERRGQFAEVVDAYLRPEAVERAYMGRPIPDSDRYIPLTTNFTDPQNYLHDYYCHLDPSSTTAGFGFAMGHMETFLDEKENPVQHVVFDIVKRWKPQDFKPDEVIDWEYVMNEVFGWVTLFRPVEVSMDQYNSDAPIQWLSKELRNRNIGGIRVLKKTATAQTNWDRAEIFKTALYRNLIHIPFDHEDCRYSSLELKYLQQHNTGGKFPRVDKQDIGPVQTKDMADCVMTVTESIIGNIILREQMEGLGLSELRMGASGGFMIGGYAPGTKAAAIQDSRGKRSGEQSLGNGRGGANQGASISRAGSWSIRGRRRGRR